MKDKTFAQKLRILRKAKNMTQKELAEDLNVARSTVSEWENGIRYPSLRTIKSISEYFSVPNEYLLTGIDITKDFNIDFSRLNDLGCGLLKNFYDALLSDVRYTNF